MLSPQFVLNALLSVSLFLSLCLSLYLLFISSAYHSISLLHAFLPVFLFICIPSSLSFSLSLSLTHAHTYTHTHTHTQTRTRTLFLFINPTLIYFFFVHFSLFLHALLSIGLKGRVFANGLGDRGSIPGRDLPKTLKMLLDTSLLNT